MAVRRPTREELAAAEGRTVPDVIAPNLRMLFCGINPGLYSGAVGHHFARPGNRFWKVLQAAGFTSEVVSPFEEETLLALGLGITNLVERATASAADLSPDDLRKGARRLEAKVRRYCPRLLGFLGMSAFRTAFRRPRAALGPQPEDVGGATTWLLPNPSGAQVHYQLRSARRRSPVCQSCGDQVRREGGFRSPSWCGGVDTKSGREHRDMAADELTERGIGAASSPPPSALSRWAGIRAEVGGPTVVFLDYDGTLTPIVERPEDAVLSAATREAVRSLAQTCPVAIVSGRDLSDVRERVDVDGVVYAGSHGFDLAAPPGLDLEEAPVFDDLLPTLDDAQAEVARAVAGVAGAWVERKRFTIAVHYRQVSDQDVPVMVAAVDGVAARYQGLRTSAGKKVVELRLDVAWDKGAAVLWLLGRLGLDRPDVVPFYLGDDTTDEDAFRAIGERGIGIVVGAAGRPTAARYSLADPDEVRVFLERLSGP